MNKKTMWLALTVVSAAMFAMPAVASAGEPEVHCPSGIGGPPVACGAFTVHGGASVWSQPGSPGPTWACTTSTGSGTFTSKKDGTFQAIFHGCKEPFFGTNCHSPGQPPGTIQTNVMPFGTRYLTHGKSSPGIIVSNFNTTFTCLGGFPNHFLVTGSVLGTLTKPGCGGSGVLALSFVALAHGVQQHKLVTNTGTAFNLKKNGADTSLNSTMTLTVPGKTPTVTCV